MTSMLHTIFSKLFNILRAYLFELELRTCNSNIATDRKINSFVIEGSVAIIFTVLPEKSNLASAG